jgi:hypothetical protein
LHFDNLLSFKFLFIFLLFGLGWTFDVFSFFTRLVDEFFKVFNKFSPIIDII